MEGEDIMDLAKEFRLIDIAEKYWEAQLDNDEDGMKYWKQKMDEENPEGAV